MKFIKGVFKLLAIGVACVIGLLIVAGVSTNSSKRDASRQGPALVALGEPFRTNKVEVTVTSVQLRSRVGDKFFNSAPAEGGVYVAVTWKVKNISEQPLNTWSKPSLHLLAPNGVEYDADISASGSFATERGDLTAKVLSDLNPGITTTDASVFEVAAGAFNKETWRVKVEADKDAAVLLN